MSKYTAEQYRAEAGFAEFRGDGRYTADMLHQAAAILDAEGDGGAVAKVRHFDYHGIARNGFSQEAEMLDGAPMLPDGTLLYTHPARSGVVGDADVLNASTVYLCSRQDGMSYDESMRAALEHFAKGERHE